MVLHKAIKNLITGEVQYDSLHKQAECKVIHSFPFLFYVLNKNGAQTLPWKLLMPGIYDDSAHRLHILKDT